MAASHCWAKVLVADLSSLYLIDLPLHSHGCHHRALCNRVAGSRFLDDVSLSSSLYYLETLLATLENWICC